MTENGNGQRKLLPSLLNFFLHLTAPYLPRDAQWKSKVVPSVCVGFRKAGTNSDRSAMMLKTALIVS